MADDSQSRPSWLWGVTLALGALVLLALAHLAQGRDSFLDSLEAKSLDARFLLSHGLKPGTQDRNIVIVAVDETGLDFFEYQGLLSDGQKANIPWPWPRAFYGYLVRHLKAAGARAVFFDFLFNSQSVLDRFYEYRADEATDDPAFAEACREAGNVYQSLLLRRRDEARPSSVRQAVEEKLARVFPLEGLARCAIEPPTGVAPPPFDQVDAPLPLYVETARGLGVVNAVLDADGILRRIGLFYRVHLAPPYAPKEAVLTLPSIQWAVASALEPGLKAPWDESGEIIINWHGGSKTYRHLPAHEIIGYELNRAMGAPTPPLDPAAFDFKDKIVLVGTSATGLYDLKSNPFTREYPGVEAHATVIDNLIHQDFVTRPGVALRLGAAAALFLIAALALIRPMPISASIAVILLLLVGYLGLAFYLFHGHRLWIDAVHPAIGLLVVFAGAQSFHYFTEGKRKRAIRSAFQRYLPPTVVAEVLKVPPDQLKLGGDRRELTVHFSDIQNFTHISESLEPEMLVKMLNVYLGEMSDIIAAHHGTLDKYIGDCVMAFWGAPLPLEGGALHACQAALEEQARLRELNRRFAAEGRPLLFARIGINTGPMLVGNMGSDQHFAYTVMGDAVNLASRLEGTNKEYGTYNMLGPLTYERAQEHIEARELDLIRVKGKAQPVRIYELLSEKGKLDDVRKRCRDRFAQGLKLYRERAWKEAQDIFSEIFVLNPEDGPALTYRDRTLYYQEFPPPEDWDGVYTMKTK